MRVEDIQVDQVIAIRYCDSEYNITFRGVTVTDVDYNAIIGWCHERKAYRKFIKKRILEAVEIVTQENPKLPIGVGTTVYIVQDNEIKALNIACITNNENGYHYDLTNGEGIVVLTISNPKHLNTTKTACANEWLKAQGLGKINEC